MKLLELHILQSFPVTCLNRDDVGAPKSAVFGGVQRARVSSQCWKRAIRLCASELSDGRFAGQRGHYLAERLAKELRTLDVAEEQAKEAAESISAFLGDHDPKHKEQHKTKVALYLSPGEIKAIAQAAADEIGTGKLDLKKGYIKDALKKARPMDAADIAIFGRMVANDHTLMLEGAGLFSHALSTHPVSNEIDFFSAVDDLKPEESEGAGHIGTLEFNSACYYRYVGLNLDLLSDDEHLDHLDSEGRRTVVETFLKSSITALPTARHNSMFGHTAPSFVLGLARSGQPLSLINAFERPVRSNDGYVEKSRNVLLEHFEGLKQAFGVSVGAECKVPDRTLDELVEVLSTHV